MTRMMEALATPRDAPQPASSPPSHEAWVPHALRDYLDRAGAAIVWRKAGPGIDSARLPSGDVGERVYLLRSRPGLQMPDHAHAGEEWTLVLQGGYHVGETGYARGDLHREDEACMHRPIIDDDGEACIALVVDEGALRFRNPVLRLLQPLFGL